MKTLFTLFFFVLFSYSAYSQGALEYFTAQEGVASVTSEASEDGISDPTFVFIGTANQSITIPFLGDVKIEFLMESGTSNTWLYILRSKSNDELRLAYAVVKIPVLGFQAQQFPVEDVIGEGQDIDLTTSLSDTDWMDSDAAATVFQTSTELYNFYTNNPEPDVLVVGLFINTSIPFVNEDEPIWGITIEANGVAKACAANAETGDLTCSEFTSVEEYLSIDQIELFPNPARDMININLPSEMTAGNSIEILDPLGRVVAVINDNYEGTIDISGLSTGTYFLRINTGNQIFTGKFLKSE